MYVPAFAELAGPEEEFFPAHFGRAPLHRPGALEGDPRQILSVADPSLRAQLAQFKETFEQAAQP